MCFYEDGTQTSNRKVPALELGGLDGDTPARSIVEAQDREIGAMSGRPRGRIKSIKRAAARPKPKVLASSVSGLVDGSELLLSFGVLSRSQRGATTMARKYSKSASKDVERAVHKEKRGTLKSGSGKTVKSRKQAIAIGLSEARKKGKKVPRKKAS